MIATVKPEQIAHQITTSNRRDASQRAVSRPLFFIGALCTGIEYYKETKRKYNGMFCVILRAMPLLKKTGFLVAWEDGTVSLATVDHLHKTKSRRPIDEKIAWGVCSWAPKGTDLSS